MKVDSGNSGNNILPSSTSDNLARISGSDLLYLAERVCVLERFCCLGDEAVSFIEVAKGCVNA